MLRAERVEAPLRFFSSSFWGFDLAAQPVTCTCSIRGFCEFRTIEPEAFWSSCAGSAHPIHPTEMRGVDQGTRAYALEQAGLAPLERFAFRWNRNPLRKSLVCRHIGRKTGSHFS
jgi:hypothetical protein